MTPAEGTTQPLLTIAELAVGYRLADGEVPAVQGASLDVAPGEVVAIVGESGSGKSTVAMAALGLLPPNGRVKGGSIRFLAADGAGGPPAPVELTTLSERGWRRLRGRRIGLVPQDPTVSLNPVRTIGAQVAEVLRTHGLAGRREAWLNAIELLDRAGLDNPAARVGQYPHELSGGMRQRVLIAIATAAEPSLIIADEPTSALDATVQRRILDHLDLLRAETGTSMLLITHDLGVAGDRADRIVVMSGGRIVEHGASRDILRSPAHPYTQRLIAAAPGLKVGKARVGPSPAKQDPVAGARRPPTVPLLRVEGLTKDFALPRAAGHREVVRAVDDVGFTIDRGRTLALVGESGSGKSTTARLVLRLVEPTNGEIHFDGTDITRLRGPQWRDLRRRAQLIYQNPYASLNPRWTVSDIITEPLRAFRSGSAPEQRARAAELVDRVALPTSALRRKPAELSGGQRQRVAIARALALSPDLVVCDEPVSALDVSVQAQVLDLLQQLQADLGLSYLFISHDLAVVRQISHDVGVMRSGRLLELRPTEDLFTAPEHDYTRDLLSAIAGRSVAAVGAPTHNANED